MILYDETICLSNTTLITNLCIKLIIATKSCAYNCKFTNHPKCKYFISPLLETILEKILINCPTEMIGNFNIDMLPKTSE
jgi:hypothetical protein